MKDEKNDKADSKIGEIYVNSITGKAYLILFDIEGEYGNSREYLLLDDETGKPVKIMIFRGK